MGAISAKGTVECAASRNLASPVIEALRALPRLDRSTRIAPSRRHDPRRIRLRTPPELIAQHPPEVRGAGRLLHVDAPAGALGDGWFRDLPDHLRAGDVVVMNDTRVIPARLFGTKATGGRVEVLVERVLGPSEALTQLRASKPPAPGSRLVLEPDLDVEVLGREGEFWHLRFAGETPLLELLDRHGRLPLPPYIERAAGAEDDARYQTVYAKRPGAVAAPTAGLHFDEAMLERVRATGAQLVTLTLHVGAGTFQPVRVDDISQHRMHSEWYDIPQDVVDAVAQARRTGGRVMAIGTTSLRALESAAAATGTLQAGSAETQLFITPGFIVSAWSTASSRTSTCRSRRCSCW
jgi:S-adenosylmethionine:tRNA ribosyltransferase-isomerase